MKFLKQEGGSVMAVSAVVLPLVALSAVGAVEIAQSHNFRMYAQKALDAAVISLASRAVGANEIDNAGERFFTSNLGEERNGPFDVETQFVLDGDIVEGTATFSRTGGLLAGFGIDINHVSVYSAAGRVNPMIVEPVEIAVVFDISTSMRNDMDGDSATTSGEPSRFDLAQDAARSFIGEVAAMGGGNAKMAFVTFGNGARISPAYFGPQLEATSYGGYTRPESSAEEPWVLALERYGDVAYTDASPALHPMPFALPNEPYTDPMTGQDRTFAPPNSFDPMPLTDNFDALQQHVDRIQPFGGTAGQSGLAWGWYALSPHWRDYWNAGNAGAADYGAARKIIVLMTDGDINTEVRPDLPILEAEAVKASGVHPFYAEPVAATAHFLKLCENARGAGVEIYTIRLSTGDADTLTTCAGDAERFVDAQTAAELVSGFTLVTDSFAVDEGSTRLLR